MLLIKTAWGGRAVKYTFRPPSAIPSDEEIKAQVVEIEKRRQEKIKNYEADKAAGKKKLKPAGPERTFKEHHPPFSRPPIRPDGCFRGRPPKANY